MTDEYLKGALDERRRVEKILSSPEAIGREALAKHFATGTAMSVPEAIAALAAAPSGQTVGQFEYEQGAAAARRLLGKDRR